MAYPGMVATLPGAVNDPLVLGDCAGAWQTTHFFDFFLTDMKLYAEYHGRLDK